MSDRQLTTVQIKRTPLIHNHVINVLTHSVQIVGIATFQNQFIIHLSFQARPLIEGAAAVGRDRHAATVTMLSVIPFPR